MSDSTQTTQKLPYLHRRSVVPALPEDASVLTAARGQFEQNVQALTASLQQFEQDVSALTPAPQKFGQNITALVTSLQQFGESVSSLSASPEQFGEDAARRITSLQQVGQEITALAAAPQQFGQDGSQHIAALQKSKEAAIDIIALVIALIQLILGGKGVTTLPDLNNVQGDVYFQFPKRWERFLFFKISDVTEFRKALGKYAPRITSSKQTHDHVNHIHDKGGKDRDIVSTGIAFARAGLHKLDVKEELGDPYFDKGSQFDQRDILGDQGTYHVPFNTSANTDGVILVTARGRDTCEKQTNEIKDIFSGSIDVKKIYEGRVREREEEHFGYRDGISQPALAGISKPKPGQRLVKPGVIILGYPGDPLYGSGSRPSFTKDGSFLAFRKLEQNSLFFNYYVSQHWNTIPVAPDPDHKINLTQKEREALFGARLFGRFRSGVPLALRPYKDDPNFDPKLFNDFNYTERSPQYGCPYAAHIRKTAPRDSSPIISKAFLDASVIVRSGIPYGDDPTPEERAKFDKLNAHDKYNYENERGLLFVSYQSSIEKGFVRQATAFGNNDWFPVTGLVPNKIGQDPIIGGPQPVQRSTGVSNVSREGKITLTVTNPENVQYEISGAAKKVDTSATAFEQKFFVTSRGGEWYFVPSISTAKKWAN